MKKVLIPTKLDEYAATLLKSKGYDVVQDANSELSELVKSNPDTNVLIVRSEKVSSDIIDSLPKLKLVVRAGAGFNTIDIKYARRKNIDVMNTPGANSNAVAEEVIAFMLAGSRHLLKADASTRAGKWEKKKFMGRELTNKTIGIVGLGNIGRLLVKRLKGFDMRVLAFDPVLSADLADRLGVELCDMDTLFSESDFVSLHIPENDVTRKMINKKYFSQMKEGAMLINCARAGIIDEDDLRAIKAEKKLIFCNDVYPKDAAAHQTVTDIADIMLPHLGASTVEANFNAARQAAEQTIAYFDKGVTSAVVNKAVPDGLDEKYQSLASMLSGIASAYLGKRPPSKIETSFYGDLQQYSKWLLAPIVAGLSADFDPFLDLADAEKYLDKRGIQYDNREVDDSKKYGNSITIDLLEGDDAINRVSVRGTITEGHVMIARINNYDNFYLEPTGHNLFVGYDDKPGVIGKIASVLGEHSINIMDLRAPQDLKRNSSLAVIKTNVTVPSDVVAEIKKLVDAYVAFTYDY